MWTGIYERWNPIPHLDGTSLYVEAVHDDWEGFRIWFGTEHRNAGIAIIVRFEAHLLYVNSDEGSRLMGIENGPLDFPHLFWKVSNSGLIKEFHRQSSGIYDNREVVHYAFLGCTDCIDVLSISEPKIEVLLDADSPFLRDSK